MSEPNSPFGPFGFPQFDPSKMDPALMMELSQLIQQLPPQQLQRMQTLVHNMMAGFDVRQDMEEFERSLPPGFREKLASIMARQQYAQAGAPSASSSGAPDMTIVPPATASPGEFSEPESAQKNMDIREARLTVLRAVADGSMAPEEAERVLFPG